MNDYEVKINRIPFYVEAGTLRGAIGTALGLWEYAETLKGNEPKIKPNKTTILSCSIEARFLRLKKKGDVIARAESSPPEETRQP